MSSTDDATARTEEKAAKKRRARRSFLVPEAIQTSAMDCGPACLKSVLEGYGVSVSYGRLREACHTSIDGTAVASLEAVLRELGLDASESVMPAEHLLMNRADLMPAIVVTAMPSGILHFVVVWRRVGPFLQVMDPGRGRHWIHHREFMRQVAMVDVPVPLEAFEGFINDPGLRRVIVARLKEVGCGRAQERFDSALAQGWQGFCHMEGALRLAERLRGQAEFSASQAEKVIDGLVAAAAANDDAIPEALRLAKFSPDAQEDIPQEERTPEGPTQRAVKMVKMRGAVAIALDGVRPVSQTEAEPTVATATSRALSQKEEPITKVVWRLITKASKRAPWLLGAGLAAAAAGSLVEAVLFRAFFDIGRRLPMFSDRVVAVSMVALFAAALLLIEWPTALGMATMGRNLEGGLRRAFLKKLPRLQDAYFQSRPVSDMATRAHQIHQIRSLPFYAGQIFRVACELVVTTAGVIWLHPKGTVLALVLMAVLVGLPLMMQGGHEERDMRVRSHAGALSVFYLDALLGLQAVRAHAGETALMREHATRLEEWARSAWQAARYAVRSEAMVTLAGYSLALWLLFDHMSGAPGSGWALLLVYWCLSLPALGQEFAFLLQQIPRQKNLAARLLEPLGAAEAERPAVKDIARGDKGVDLVFEDVRVQAGGHEVLALDGLHLPSGGHVALVGASGSGKSSLLGLVMGWHEAAVGRVLFDEQPSSPAALELLRRQTVWVDPSVQLWNRSLLENLRYGSARPDSPVGAAIEDAELDEVLARLPTGLESSLGESGGLLSGGEGQRVRLGRNMHKEHARLVLLDEAFRGLERPRRQRLLARARERWASATFLCATHDVADALVFDRVLVIAGGRVAEDGIPRELAKQPDSLFAKFLEMEERLQAKYSAPFWRRWQLVDGRVEESAPQLPGHGSGVTTGGAA